MTLKRSTLARSLHMQSDCSHVTCVISGHRHIRLHSHAEALQPDTMLFISRLLLTVMDHLAHDDEQVRGKSPKPFVHAAADDSQDKEAVREDLYRLWCLKQERPHLFLGLPHTIAERASKGGRTRSRLESYTGPSGETIRYLELTAGDWMSDPRNFWMPPAIRSSSSSHEPEAQMVELYLQAWQSDM
nr:hypothetical protein CFP56_33422 [Quercus suber]